METFKKMKYFKELTIGEKNNAVVMGRKTWLSIPRKIDLCLKENIVLTSRLFRPTVGRWRSKFYKFVR